MKKFGLMFVLLFITLAYIPTTPASAVANWPVIRRGNTGSQVRTIQYLLFSHGYSATIDGNFSANTESYVKQFQAARGLAADGIVGSGTWVKLVKQVDYSLATQSSANAALEVQLQRHGYYMNIDFQYGSATRYAVLDFKAKHYLGSSTVVGASTWQELVGSNTIDKTSTSTYLTQSQGQARLSNAGITWSASGNCTDRTKPNCTSMSGILSGTIDGVAAFKQGTGCAVNVTGGTEVGHSTTYDSPFTHTNGHKIDISAYDTSIFGSKENCATKFIKQNFTYIGTRSDLDNAPLYMNSRGDLYALEADHWDISYYSYN